MTIFLFVVLIAAVGSGLYLSIMYSSIPGAVDERLGKFEELPGDVGQWVVDATSDAGKRAQESGKSREVRTLHQAGSLFRRDHFVLQARLRNAQSGEVESVEPERQIRRRRLKA